MTLDEAIKHAEEKSFSCDNTCGAEHAQLASWLRELKTLRELMGVLPGDGPVLDRLAKAWYAQR